MLLLGVYRDFKKPNTYKGGVYSIEEWNGVTWSPAIWDVEIEPFDRVIHGKTYKDKQGDAREHAIRLQYLMSLIDLSYHEYSLIEGHLYRLGKRYGLLTEFRENGLC